MSFEGSIWTAVRLKRESPSIVREIGECLMKTDTQYYTCIARESNPIESCLRSWVRGLLIWRPEVSETFEHKRRQRR